MTSAGTPEKLQALRDNLALVIKGKESSLDLLIISLLANGSVLMEDVPGVGKTTLAKALAKSIDVSFNRVQFTPDLLPADILGASVYNPVEGTFNFRQGPVFCNVLLADEINRASPRTQSALLEAMSEAQATIEGTRHVLPAPFLVIATQNPVEFHGTYPLPEAQLDRFLMWLNLGYPDAPTEVTMLYALAEQHPLETLKPVLTSADVAAMQEAVTRVHVEETVSRYLVDIVQRTRTDDRLKLGVSPRGSLMLFRAAQGAAFLDNRDFVMPDDILLVAPHVLAHRLILTPKAKYGSVSKFDIVNEAVHAVKIPT